MAKSLLLRREKDLPPDVCALLHGPAPDGVWYLPSHPRIGNPFRFAAIVSLVVLAGASGLFLITAFDSVRAARFRSEGLIITGGMLVFAAGVHWLCWRAKKKAERLEADLAAGRVRFGLWLTSDHVLSHDDEGIDCARRQDIAETHIYHGGLRLPNLLVVTLTNGHEAIRIIVNSLDGWAGRDDELRGAFEARLLVNPGISAGEVQRIADLCLPKKNFGEFTRWLDGEAQRLKSGPAERAALISMADAALASWPDAARSPDSGDFMVVEVNSVWEYGVNANSGPDFFYHGFKKKDASWMLPLSRSVHFFESASIFTDVASVRDCAATFQNVPLTEIHYKRGMDAAVFDAFLAWVATKPMKKLDELK